ncbi:MAG: ATP-dependent Clp protease adapter ClpS [Campylobacteraceae bacterium]|nr:ATP-dependent Clp protease adapter ClpS [Campylobacteraceae bacterium]
MSLKEAIKSDVKISPPKRYVVILLNDDFTSMDFVVEVLMDIFLHSIEKAISIMLKVHEKGQGVCGVYTREIAETKVTQVHERAKRSDFPLRAIMKEE